MPKNNFSISSWSVNSDISLEVDKITGIGGPEYPRLVIPIEFTLRPRESEDKIFAFTLFWIRSSLYIDNIKIGEGVSDTIAEYSYPHLSPRSVSIEIPLDMYRIKKIEERRRGDIQFRLSGSTSIVEHPPIAKTPATEKIKYRKDVETFTTGRFDITFAVPHSHWIKNVLPGLGYGKFGIIEIPIPEKIFFKELENSEKELIQAQNYFIQGDYDKAVGHCRSAVEPLKELLNEIKSLLTESKYDWINEIGEATYNWIDKVNKKTRDIGSKPHHTPSVGHFSRVEANTIILITTALLSYIGDLLKQEENKT